MVPRNNTSGSRFVIISLLQSGGVDLHTGFDGLQCVFHESTSPTASETTSTSPPPRDVHNIVLEIDTEEERFLDERKKKKASERVRLSSSRVSRSQRSKIFTGGQARAVVALTVYTGALAFAGIYATLVRHSARKYRDL